jgi:hypothetical protein
MDGRALAERVRLRYAWAMVAANFVGGLVLFVLLSLVLPSPPVRHPDTVKLLSIVAFVLDGAIGFPAAWLWSARAWRERHGWVDRGRPPTQSDRDRALGFPRALTEKRDPTDVVKLLYAFFAVVVDVVSDHGGWVNKFDGDAALRVFGAPLPDPDAASQALAAGRRLSPPPDRRGAGRERRDWRSRRARRRRQHRRRQPLRVHGDRRSGERRRPAVRPGQGQPGPRLGRRGGARAGARSGAGALAGARRGQPAGRSEGTRVVRAGR